MSKDYKIIMAEHGISGTDAVNKFTTNNPGWTLYNVVPSDKPGMGFAFIFERPKKEDPKNTPPTGGTEASLLTESTNVVSFRRAA
jgi:hypothetical protein